MNLDNAGRGSDPVEMVDINTTPLIDVMLVLLIMLIITIPVQTHAVKLDLPVPQSQQVPPEPPPVVNLEIDFDGAVYWDGALVAGRAELRQRFREAHQQPRQPEFHLRPNRLVAYKHVAAVMAEAQKLGITHIGLVSGA